jgi:hypothetical protein
LWFYQVEERTPVDARLRNLGNGKVHRVRHGGRLPAEGAGVITRLLPFRGREFCGHAVLGFDPALPRERLETLFHAGCRDLKVKPSVTLRPDVHCEEWRRHGSVFLALWRAETYDARVGRPSSPSQAAAAGGSRPGPVLEASVPDPASLAAWLAAGRPELKAAGTNQWELRFRALRLGRLELRTSPGDSAAGTATNASTASPEVRGSRKSDATGRSGVLTVVLADPGFVGYARDWLKGRLGRLIVLADGGAPDPLPGEGAADLDAWVHTPLESLNGQSPVQASTHDWGRRRLQTLLREMVKQGRDVTSLRRQLGL